MHLISHKHWHAHCMIYATILLFKCYLAFPSLHFDCTIKIMPNVFTRRSSIWLPSFAQAQPALTSFFFAVYFACPFLSVFFFSYLLKWPWSVGELLDEFIIIIVVLCSLTCNNPRIKNKTCTWLFKWPSWVPVQTELPNISVCVAWHYYLQIFTVQYAWDRNRYTLLSHQSWLT